MRRRIISFIVVHLLVGPSFRCQVSRALSLELCRTLSKQARVVGDEGGGLELVGKLPHAKGTIIAGP